MADDTENLNRLTFDYEKAEGFRVIHVDGAHGGLSPTGGLVVSLFSERKPIPRREVYDVVDNAMAKVEAGTVKRDCDVLREVEVCAIMSIGAATVLHKWLGEKIAEHAQLFAMLKSQHDAHVSANPEVIQ